MTLEPEKAFDPACSVNKDVGVVVSSLASDGLQEEEKNNEVTVCFLLVFVFEVTNPV